MWREGGVEVTEQAVGSQVKSCQQAPLTSGKVLRTITCITPTLVFMRHDLLARAPRAHCAERFCSDWKLCVRRVLPVALQ